MVSVYAANLIGTSGPDTLVGTDEDDNIFGLGGNDRISDGFGSDEVFAGSGDDTINLEGTRAPGDNPDPTSQDVVYGEKGRDTINAPRFGGFLLIYGGDDDDTISGSSGNTGRIYGGDGNDKVVTSDTVFLMSGVVLEMIILMVKANVAYVTLMENQETTELSTQFISQAVAREMISLSSLIAEV